jgi:hypothetical protein
MVARWPDGNEGGGPAVAAQGVDGGDSRPGGVDRGIPRGGDCEGVGVEVPAAPDAEVMDRVDVAGVVDELEDIPVHGWRLEVIDVQGGGADPADDGVDPRNAFGMTDRRPVMATELVRDKEQRHSAIVAWIEVGPTGVTLEDAARTMEMADGAR